MTPVTTVIARRRTLESLLEGTLPVLSAMTAAVVLLMRLSRPWAGRPLTDLEVFITVAGLVVVMTWMVSRLAFLAGMRRPWKFVVLNLVLVGGFTAVLPSLSSLGFEITCRTLKGRMPEVAVFAGLAEPDPRGEATGYLGTVCQLNPDAATAALPGTLLRPAWRGAPQLLPFGYPAIALIILLTALGLRDRRLVRTQMARAAWHHLRLAPAAGSAAAYGYSPLSRKGADDFWNACANPTLWGEVCGQLYHSSYRFRESEACVRCGLLFRPAPLLKLAVVSLRFGDVDYLNNLETQEALIWKQGEPPPRRLETLSPRWVQLGELTLPEVLTFSQALALIHEWMARLAPTENTQRALELALRQSSRLAAWCWFSPGTPRLGWGIPTRDIALATGAQRLRDFFSGRPGWKALQLDIGLLPVDLRLGLWKPPELSLSLAGGLERGQRFNNRQVFWLPVSSVALSSAGGNQWVPRVEGAGLRSWLTLTSRAAHFRPAPYFWEEAPWRDDADLELPHDVDRAPLSLVRLPSPEEESLTQDALLGCRLSEWDWLDRRHLELLRRQAVFMAPFDVKRWNIQAARRPTTIATTDS